MTASRTKRVAPSLDPREHADLVLAAKREGVTVAQYVRTTALAAARAPNPPAEDRLAGAVLDAWRVIARFVAVGLPEPLGIAVAPDGRISAWLDTEGLFTWQVRLEKARIIRPTPSEARRLSRADKEPTYFEVTGVIDGHLWKLRNTAIPMATPTPPALPAAEPPEPVEAELVEDDDYVDDLNREQALDARRVMSRAVIAGVDPLYELGVHGYRVGYDRVLAADVTRQFAAISVTNGAGHR